ncbi:hypothetical protein [Labrenzia sp. OB1]|uniref:hypothetical protein n=1 Tax=Labrenzia sp. OB1 TaxID=1561204 RepID=UPI0007B2931A|nr:hypothetical protein [Labrenzia sp. OB1]KZM48045.1 hypothetical protein OA90_22820 [Labrenzia sp. OB1]
MISAIVDGVLLIALVATTVRMLAMQRELRRLGTYHADYKRIFDQTVLALDGIEVSIQEINVKSAQILNALGNRMDDARELIAEIDGLTREAKRQQTVLRAELKELSKATALFETSNRLSPSKGDLEIFADSDGPAAALQHAGVLTGGRAQKEPASIHRGEAPKQVPARIHRIDNPTGSPFRTVSMNQKDKM